MTRNSIMIKRIFTIIPGIGLLTLLVFPLTAISETSHDWKTSLQNAEDFFKDGLDGNPDSFFYALDEYKAAMDAGAPEDARIFYNWGNTLYMAGYMPEAALQFRKALYLKPGDNKIRENLSLTLNKEEDKNSRLLQKILFAPVFLMGYKNALYSGLFLFCLAWTLVIVNLLTRKKRHIPILILLCLSLWTLSVSGIWHFRAAGTGVILTDSASLRKGDSRAYDLISENTIPGGSVFRLMEERRGWSLIRLENNQEGWIETLEIRMLLE